MIRSTLGSSARAHLLPPCRDLGTHYGRDFKARLEASGFIVRLEDLRHELGEERARRYGLRERSSHLHLCVKSDVIPKRSRGVDLARAGGGRFNERRNA